MKEIKMQAVTSSNISRVGYDDEDSTLRIEYGSGDSWDYADVPQARFESLLAAPSIGKYVNQFIKGAYAGKKVS